MVCYWMESKGVEGARLAIGPREGKGWLWLAARQVGLGPWLPFTFQAGLWLLLFARFTAQPKGQTG